MDQFAGLGAADAGADQPAALRVEQRLGHPGGASGQGAAVGPQGNLPLVHAQAAGRGLRSVRPTQATSGRV